MQVNVTITSEHILDIELDHHEGTVIIKLPITPDQAIDLAELCMRDATLETFEVGKRDKDTTAIVCTATTIHA